MGSALGVYSVGLICVSARTNKRHYHHNLEHTFAPTLEWAEQRHRSSQKESPDAHYVRHHHALATCTSRPSVRWPGSLCRQALWQAGRVRQDSPAGMVRAFSISAEVSPRLAQATCTCLLNVSRPGRFRTLSVGLPAWCGPFSFRGFRDFDNMVLCAYAPCPTEPMYV